MDKFKFQVLGIIICLGIGVAVGYFSHKKGVEQEIQKIEQEKKALQHQVDSLTSENQKQDNHIKNLELLRKLDSVKIKEYYFNIKVDGVKTVKKIDSLKKLPASEKRIWLLNRYSSPAKH